MDNITKQKIVKINTLLIEVDDEFLRFFDTSSTKMLDEKIQVLTDLKNGKTISEIPNFYDILELYPGDNVHWD